VFLKGLETLHLRMQAHCASAARLALWLSQRTAIGRVFYPGLPDHPQHALAQRQHRPLADGSPAYGGIVSFEVKGGREAAWKVIDSVRMLSITANLGDTRTTITHPATTTHGRISEEARRAAGITEGLVRVAVGLEQVDDIIADLARGLGA
jgi:O-succinylhomoserine sulfhydrylase